ncbi:hypothetical protein FXB39_09835 [Nocardioides sp. BGMRC 2183]|nr:hypothetical protein FXB39_09835 [Nocardioides sp. BGMRC 2183]
MGISRQRTGYDPEQHARSVSRRGATLGILLSILVALLCVVVVGFLDVRAEAVETGAVVGWDTEIQSLTDPAAPVLQRLMIAVACSLVAFAYAFWLKASAVLAGISALTTAVTLCALSGWFYATTDFPYSAIATAVESPESPLVSWLRAGALSPAIQVLAGVLLALAMLAFAGSRSTAGRKSQ